MRSGQAAVTRRQYLQNLAAPEIPKPLIDQMAEGGRLVAPVGSRDYQELIKLVKRGGRIETIPLGGVCFVPLIGQFGWQGGYSS